MAVSSISTFLLAFLCCVQGFHTAGEHQQRVCALFPANGGKVTSNDGTSENQITSDDISEDYGARETEGTSDPHQMRCSTNFCYAAIIEDPLTNETKVIKQGCWESSGKHDCEKTSCVPPKGHQPKNKMRFCCCAGDMCNSNINITEAFVEEGEEGEEYDTPLKAGSWLVQESGKATFFVWMSVVVTLCVGMLVGAALYCSWRGIQGAGLQKCDPDAVRLMENGRSPGTGYGRIMGMYSSDQLELLNVVGQGRYGSVWRATVADKEVAVKIFPAHYRSYFRNEKDIYCLPFMSDCRALLTYHGCDERVNVEGAPEYLLVLSYSPNGCLQDFLRSKTIDWPTFCKMSFSVAQGLAHLHTDFHKGDKVKPCVSHRDLNTRNILVNADLSCSLCDLGFSMKIIGSKYYQNGEEQHAETKSINDVGTLRYMAPEVLEGAVNLRDCESSLKQIDVYALGLVLWELATRCSDLYQAGSEVNPYRMPFEAEIGQHPTFEQMQVLVLRHKARPLFPETWGDWVAVRLLRETMEDCWDQDAEARLTALCVEERLSELPALWDRHRSIYTSGLSPMYNLPQGLSSIRTSINNSISNNTGSSVDTQRIIMDSTEGTGVSARSVSSNKDFQESTVSEGTVETLLTLSPSDPPDSMLYKTWVKEPLQPYQGRNPCMERNLMPPAVSEEELNRQGSVLVDRSSKHAPQGHCRSGSACADSEALVSNDFLSHQQQLNTATVRPITPIPFVQNVYNSQQPNVEQNVSKHGLFSGLTGGIRKLLDSKKKPLKNAKDDVWKGGVGRDLEEGKSNLLQGRETQVSLAARKNSGVVTTVLTAEEVREEAEEPPLASQSSSALRPTSLALTSKKSEVVKLRSACNNSSSKRKRLSAECDALFASSSVDWKLKDPNLRIKTPGDVPASVRKNRGRGFSTRFSLYDDRIMSGAGGDSNAGSSDVDFIELEKDGVLEVCIPNMFSSVPYQINSISDESDVNDSTF